MVECHTYNVPYHNGILLDNWDLSVKRATAVVRILQNEYGLDPTKIAAAGRGEYKPLTTNNDAKAVPPIAEQELLFYPNWTSSLNCWNLKKARFQNQERKPSRLGWFFVFK